MRIFFSERQVPPNLLLEECGQLVSEQICVSAQVGKGHTTDQVDLLSRPPPPGRPRIEATIPRRVRARPSWRPPPSCAALTLRRGSWGSSCRRRARSGNASPRPGPGQATPVPFAQAPWSRPGRTVPLARSAGGLVTDRPTGPAGRERPIGRAARDAARTSPARRCAWPTAPAAAPRARDRCAARARPAPSAAPTCTSSTASCRGRSCRSFPGHEIVGVVDGGRRRASTRLRARRPRRRALARLDLRRRAATAASGRENLCDRGALHRLHARRRLRRVRRRRRSATASRCPAGYSRRRGRAAAVRRADRLPLAGAWPATRARLGHLRLRRRGPHRRPGGALPGPRGLSPSRARATRRRRSFARELGAAWAGGSDEPPPAELLDAAIIFAPGRRAGARWRCAPCARAARWCAAAST